MAAIAWATDDGDVTTVLVWETPAARGDFALERMMPLFEAGILGEEHGHPQRVTLQPRWGDPQAFSAAAG